MAVAILMPKLGLTMTEGLVAKWYKNEGDTVKPFRNLPIIMAFCGFLAFFSAKYTPETPSAARGIRSSRSSLPAGFLPKPQRRKRACATRYG